VSAVSFSDSPLSTEEPAALIDMTSAERRFAASSKLDDVRVEAPGADGASWAVTAELANTGSGAMPVEVAAVRGVRFPGPDDGDAEPYREARAIVRPEAGGSSRVEIVCDFEPERLVVDPDARVLMLRRESAVAEL